MDERPDEIIDQIEAKRDELGRNLNELEEKVRRTADWRAHYDKNPMLILGAALGGGLLLGSMVGGGRSKSHTKGIRPWKPSSNAGTSTSSSRTASYNPPASPEHTAASFVSSAPKSSLMSSGQMHQVTEALDQIKGALVAFGIAKAREFLSNAVPGLEHHFSDPAAGTKARNRPQQEERQTKPYTTGSSAADYRSGAQNYSGEQTSYGTTTNTGRASEADEYAGVGSPAPSSTPQAKP
jgi:hypothetical protein